MGLFISTFALADQHGQIINKGEKKSLLSSGIIWELQKGSRGAQLTLLVCRIFIGHMT